MDEVTFVKDAEASEGLDEVADSDGAAAESSLEIEDVAVVEDAEELVEALHSDNGTASKEKIEMTEAPLLAPLHEFADAPGDFDELTEIDTSVKTKAEKEKKKSLKKALKLKQQDDRKRHMSDVKSSASSFPMVQLIDEQVRMSVPKDIIKRVKAAKKKEFVSATYPYTKPLSTEDYEEEASLLEIELVKMQAWMKESGEKIVMVFEGRDAAGKGGTIKTFNEHLNPRGARVVALTKPSESERGQWYFQRYISQLPTAGEIVFFDRSWYNRAGVEHVMGFCSGHEYLEFMRQTPEFERMIVRSNIKLFKFWFSVSREEQLRRFLGRARDPLRQWKLSPMDVESLARWDEYTKAKEAMLFYTDTADAPWTVIRSDDKKRARLNAMRYVLARINYDGKDETLLETDPHVIGSAKQIYEIGENSALPKKP